MKREVSIAGVSLFPYPPYHPPSPKGSPTTTLQEFIYVYIRQKVITEQQPVVTSQELFDNFKFKTKAQMRFALLESKTFRDHIRTMSINVIRNENGSWEYRRDLYPW